MKLFHANDKSRHHKIFLLALLGLLFLRIPFIAGMRFFNVEWDWTLTVFDIGTYLLTTFLIWWEVDRLAEYHLDGVAISIIIFFKPIQTLIARWIGTDPLLMFPSVSSLLIWLIAILFAFGMWSQRSKIKSAGKHWFLIGMLAGLLTALLISFPMSFQIPEEELLYGLTNPDAAKHIWLGMLIGFPQQLGFAAIMEEPLFRGFLWGYLRRLQWREVWIWLFQAGLFMFSHIYYLTGTLPISFWILVPFGALVLGWLAWRSRTITTSMAAHAMVNATGRAFGYWVALLRLG
jgi:membrane protease YdiL (CAAX protease family)